MAAIQTGGPDGVTLHGIELVRRYVGDVNPAGLRHGKGKYEFPNPAYTYEGDFVEGRKHGVPRIGGVELVGRRIRVYWPGDDCMYGGEVVAYDDATRAHTIMYDDGDEVEEMLGSALSPEYGGLVSA